MESIVVGYLEAMLWVEEEYLLGSDVPIDAINIYNIDEQDLDTLKQQIDWFCRDNAETLETVLSNEYTWEQVGQDMYHTGNWTGTGFWDRGLGEAGEELSRNMDWDIYVFYDEHTGKLMLDMSV